VPTVIARCVHGLEWVCADEISSRLPSARAPRLGRREVIFDLPSVDSGLLRLRTVDDVFLAVGGLDDVGTARATPDGLARRLADLPFDVAAGELGAVRPLPRSPRVDVVVSVEGRRGYSRFDVEQAAGPALATRFRGSYLARDVAGRAPGEADLSVRVFLRGTGATAAIRLGRRPLHRREYKQDTGAGTLHPPVAAALARLADPADGAVVLDPFCGDGTIAVEAALAYPGARVVAADIDTDRLRNAAGNAGRAAVRAALMRADAASPPVRPGAVAAVVTNPPWNLAVDASGRLDASLAAFWVRLAELLAPDGRICVVADESLAAPEAVRRLGCPVTLATRIRLAGRVSHLVLAGRPGGPAPVLGSGPARWRARAIAAGVVTEEGF
jgi:23S rRNA G2445 N2-methylase RlmL